MAAVDLSKLVPIDKLEGEDWQETEELKALAEQAEEFLRQHEWAGNVLRQYAGPNVAGVVGVFLFRLDPAAAVVDEWLWVIVGDLPPAYLVTDNAPDGASALEVYVEAMQEWVDAVGRGESVEDLIPVDVAPTQENAQMLSSRLSFLRDRVIPEFRKDVSRG